MPAPLHLYTQWLHIILTATSVIPVAPNAVPSLQLRVSFRSHLATECCKAAVCALPPLQCSRRENSGPGYYSVCTEGISA